MHVFDEVEHVTQLVIADVHNVQPVPTGVYVLTQFEHAFDVVEQVAQFVFPEQGLHIVPSR